MSNGFKKSSCCDKKCLACTPNPPILSTQVIRKLGLELCQLEEEELSDEVLLTKRKSAIPVGKMKADPGKKERKNPGEKAEGKEDDNER